MEPDILEHLEHAQKKISQAVECARTNDRRGMKDALAESLEASQHVTASTTRWHLEDHRGLTNIIGELRR